MILSHKEIEEIAAAVTEDFTGQEPASCSQRGMVYPQKCT